MGRIANETQIVDLLSRAEGRLTGLPMSHSSIAKYRSDADRRANGSTTPGGTQTTSNVSSHAFVPARDVLLLAALTRGSDGEWPSISKEYFPDDEDIGSIAIRGVIALPHMFELNPTT